MAAIGTLLLVKSYQRSHSNDVEKQGSVTPDEKKKEMGPAVGLPDGLDVSGLELTSGTDDSISESFDLGPK
ncbi:hypothetical protein BOX15_Mlig010493g9 [Macrostomum lignano]|nr:hypothetical protein BOX15_Mlig010493g3 [Macrostomum lignano]PAA78911.1 hypothetical protein BOX15_Mlig010493g9 [Macrostomum lignano]